MGAGAIPAPNSTFGEGVRGMKNPAGKIGGVSNLSVSGNNLSLLIDLFALAGFLCGRGILDFLLLLLVGEKTLGNHVALCSLLGGDGGGFGGLL